ncbi:50S ribosomal protein L9 [Myxococcota bacterium]|nr:50S ribosomal protein L9 [Myxococcota bacterium]MBU1535656.1 50S ribosomal protein L9 [Myxococcota bacterium]
MAFMEIILRDDVQHLGKSGDAVKVKAGYGRNYLLPKGLAIKATKKNKSRLDHDRKVISIRRAKYVKTAEDLKVKLEELTFTIAKKVGENEKLFGSVTQKEVAEIIENNGYSVEKKNIHFEDNIKTLGVHKGFCDLGNGVKAELKIWVVSE